MYKWGKICLLSVEFVACSSVTRRVSMRRSKKEPISPKSSTRLQAAEKYISGNARVPFVTVYRGKSLIVEDLQKSDAKRVLEKKITGR